MPQMCAVCARPDGRVTIAQYRYINLPNSWGLRMSQNQVQTGQVSPVRNGHAHGRRLYRVNDHRLLRRLPWKAENRTPILEALGSAQVPDVIDVKALRDREGLSREDFASIYGLSVDSVRSWERGTVPSRATRAYLAIISHAPHIVRRGLGVRW